MIRPLAIAFALLAGAAAQAQSVPQLQDGNPRLQTVRWQDGEDVLLTVMPGLGATVMLERGEWIERVSASDPIGWEVRVSPEGDSFLVLPNSASPPPAARLLVETDRRQYPIVLRTGDGLTAALLVRYSFDGSQLAPLDAVASVPAADAETWSYRLRGDDVVYPQAIRDDGQRTYITYAPEQPLPAVFAIGATGEEEMVNGHMRGDVFVIDRVHQELVFRLDRERARAQRNSQPDDGR